MEGPWVAPDTVGFVVFAGSVARASVVKAIHPYMVGLRDKLGENGVLQQTPDDAHGDVLRFESDYLFGSPSTAAGVVLGRNANGRTQWKDANGRTLKEIQVAAVEGQAVTSG